MSQNEPQTGLRTDQIKHDPARSSGSPLEGDPFFKEIATHDLKEWADFIEKSKLMKHYFTVIDAMITTISLRIMQGEEVKAVNGPDGKPRPLTFIESTFALCKGLIEKRGYCEGLNFFRMYARRIKNEYDERNAAAKSVDPNETIRDQPAAETTD
jgi:hypothetical protein